MKNGWRASTYGLALLSLLLALTVWKVAWNATYAKWDIRDARLALMHIGKLRHSGLTSGTIPEALTCLKGISEEYANWHWQRPELHLGDLVEVERKLASQEIIDSLRRKTGKNFGEDPEKWIDGLRDDSSFQ